MLHQNGHAASKKMLHLMVDVIVEEANLLYGYTTDTKDAFGLLEKMYSKKKISALLLAALQKKSAGGLYMIARYYQFIVLIHIEFGIASNAAICFLDCKDQHNELRDDYPHFPFFNWEENHKQEFDHLCRTIREDRLMKKAFIGLKKKP